MATTAECFHCGYPLPSGDSIIARLSDHDRPMCCIGCKAVAEFIEASGLNAFYEFRSQPAADLNLTPEDREWQHFDDAELMGRYVSQRADVAETTIDIGGMYCSACVWLLDKAMRSLPAIENVDVNPAVRRAVIRWNISELNFSDLLQAISRIGFKPAPVGTGQNIDSKTEDYRQALKRLIVAAAAGMQVMMFAVALYAGDYFGIDDTIERFLRIVSLLLTVPVVFYSARPFFVGAARGLRARTPGMDLPVSLAIGFAFAASSIATWSNRGAIYFDSVVMFVFFLSATRFLEMRARHRSSDHAIALAQLLPDTAIQIRDGVSTRVALDRLRVGDTIGIRPGDVIPIDGDILTGTMAVDESMLSGESMPVDHGVGDAVFAGAIVRSGNATVRVTQTGASTSLAEIGRMLERARADRPPIAMLADRIAGKFVLAVLAIATAAGAIWYWLDPSRAFEVVLATLVVTCPCALALATPAALAAAASRLAKNGFLLVRSRILSILSHPTTIVFDKTGTLTEGRPIVLDTRLLKKNIDAESALRIAAALETVSEHVLARAFSAYFDSAMPEPLDVTVTAGSGVEASLDGQRYRIGKANFVAEISRSTPAEDGNKVRQTQVFLGNNDGMIAQFSLGDEVRQDARQAIRKLQQSGFTPVIASGDHKAAVHEVASHLGIDSWHAAMSPADKLRLVAHLQESGKPIIMVGDGINDAPVLAAADGSIALDSGTALARASADAVSLGRKLDTINFAIGIAQRTQRVIRQNIAWAIIYNATAVPLAISGVLLPWMAAIGMSLSSLIVVFNALRLQSTPED
ncbi:MAG: heavy metal translocating P-type ATPase [Woeseiaceae bacterium]